MIQNNNSSEGTQPNKPVFSTKLKKPKRGRTFLFNSLGLIVILAIALFGGYQAAIKTRLETKSSSTLQQLGEQYKLALVDMQSGRYENAKERLEFIIKEDPSFPGVQDTLTQVLVQMSAQTTLPTAAPIAIDTSTLSPTPDFSGVDEAFAQAQDLIKKQDWPGAIGALDEARKFNWNFNTAQVDGMYYFALRNYGYDLIVKQGNLEGGIYQLTLAERFGQLDRDANGIREGARYYILGASFWELDWKQALFYFSQVYGGWSGLWDGSMTIADRYHIASMRYGDELYKAGDCEGAIENYDNAQKVSQLDQLASNNYAKALIECAPAPTDIPAKNTPTPGAIVPTDTQPAGVPTDTPAPTDTPVPAPTDTPIPTPTP